MITVLFNYGPRGYGLLYGIDPFYLILIVPALILSLFAQFRVKSVFSKYSKIAARSGYTGQTAARLILSRNDLQGVPVERTPGQLTDHYDPRGRVLRLSESTCDSPSIAAIGVAAHEAGHAVQHQQGYLPNKIRGTLVPVAQIGSTIGPYMAIFGILLSFPALTTIGIVLFLGAVLFYLITLPVEFNASKRALETLETESLLDREELVGARKVLNAAALTYVASTIMAFASLLRLILLARGSRSNRD